MKLIFVSNVLKFEKFLYHIAWNTAMLECLTSQLSKLQRGAGLSALQRGNSLDLFASVNPEWCLRGQCVAIWKHISVYLSSFLLLPAWSVVYDKWEQKEVGGKGEIIWLPYHWYHKRWKCIVHHFKKGYSAVCAEVSFA